MKTYSSPSGYWGDPPVIVEEGGVTRPLPWRLDLVNHSPTGFAWGYSGSGPAQLALAILADLYDDQFALRHYMRFKFRVIAGLDKDTGWTLTEDRINAAVAIIASTTEGA